MKLQYCSQSVDLVTIDENETSATDFEEDAKFISIYFGEVWIVILSREEVIDIAQKIGLVVSEQ